MTTKKYYWCDKLDERISGNEQKVNCSYARCSGSCLMGRVADVCNVALAIERGDTPVLSYREWLRSTRAACRHATRGIALAERAYKKLTLETNAALRLYKREMRKAGID